MSVPKGFDPEKAKAFLKKLIAVGKLIAPWTPTPVDDMVIKFLELLAGDPAKMFEFQAKLEGE